MAKPLEGPGMRKVQSDRNPGTLSVPFTYLRSSASLVCVHKWAGGLAESHMAQRVWIRSIG